jgi:hypothetical protein
MARKHAKVVGSRLAEKARSELVAGEGLDFVRNGDGVFARGVEDRLAIRDSIDGDIDRKVVALHQLDLEVDEFGRTGRELETIPVFVLRSEFGDGFAAQVRRRREIGRIVSAGQDKASEWNGRRLGPFVVGFSFDARGAAVRMELKPERTTCPEQAGLAIGGGRHEEGPIGIAGVESFGGQELSAALELEGLLATAWMGTRNVDAVSFAGEHAGKRRGS